MDERDEQLERDPYQTGGGGRQAIGIAAIVLLGNWALKRAFAVKRRKRKLTPENKTVPMFQVRFPAADYKPPKKREADGGWLQTIVGLAIGIPLVWLIAKAVMAIR